MVRHEMVERGVRMALYRIVRELHERLFIEADTPAQAKDLAAGKVGNVIHTDIIEIECVEDCGDLPPEADPDPESGYQVKYTPIIPGPLG